MGRRPAAVCISVARPGPLENAGVTVLAKRHLDALAEFMNMGSGQAAGALAEMLDLTVLRDPPKADYWRPSTCRESVERAVGKVGLNQVSMGFSGPVSGFASILMEPPLTAQVVAHALGEDPGQVAQEDVEGTLEEIANIVLNATMGSLSNIVGMDLAYEVPRFTRSMSSNPMFLGDRAVGFARTRLRLRGPDGDFPNAVMLAVGCHVPSTFLRALDLFFRDDSVDRFLLPGEMVVGSTPCIWSTVLGSCVSVCIRHVEAPYAAMNHFLLAKADGRPNPGRFGDTSIRALWAGLERYDANPKHYRAHLFGGAQMFEAQPFDIGGRNIEIARSELDALGIPVVAEHVGGTNGMHIRFDTGLGTVTCRAHKDEAA